MALDFKPSQVVLNAPPLCATMEKSEVEWAAALIVRACQVLGDEWQPIAPSMLGMVINEDVERGVEPWASLNRNPAFRPDFWKLGESRYATMAKDRSIALTPEGLNALRRWVRAPSAKPGGEG